MENNKTIHFSIDDCIEIFNDLTLNEKKYKSIFNNKLLNLLRKYHKKYDMKISLYCFYENNDFSIKKCTEKFRQEFVENSDWLSFSFHQYSQKIDLNKMEISDFKSKYKSFIEEMNRIVGLKSLNSTTRIDKFICDKEKMEFLNNNNIYVINTFLTADSYDRPNYYLSKKENNLLKNHKKYVDKENRIKFIETTCRLENIEYRKINSIFNNKNITVFTHEWIINGNLKSRISIKLKLNKILKMAKKQNYKILREGE